MFSHTPNLLTKASRILVVSNEPWAEYHSEELSQYYAEVSVIHIVPDFQPLDKRIIIGDRSISLSKIEPNSGDILVMAGSDEWPVSVRAHFPEMPAIALRLAYLALSNSQSSFPPDYFWAASIAHADEISEHFGVLLDDIEVGHYPWKPELPNWSPEGEHILLVASVSQSGVDGGDAGSANDILYQAANLLREQNINFSISLHPREPSDRWKGFTVSNLSTLEASAKATLVIAVTGTVIESIHQIGTPIILIPSPLAPLHLYSYGTVLWNAVEIANALKDYRYSGLLIP